MLGASKNSDAIMRSKTSIVGARNSIGISCVTPGRTNRPALRKRMSVSLAKHPVPLMLLARLATDHRWQGKGVGKALLRDAMQRTLQAADNAGIRAPTVHAKDKAARRFYEHFDFVPSPTDHMHLFVLLKDVRRIIAE
jgi:GNAT superfamily N-acetyltransferase